MTFETTHKGNLWTHSKTAKGKGGRRDIVKKGVYVIDHRPSGRFIIGQANDVSKEVDKHLAQLESGKHPIKLLQRLYNTPADNHGNPPAMVVIEYPLAKDKDIKMTLEEIRRTNSTDYCLLN